MNSWSCPAPSMVAMLPEPASVRARALSTTSRRTVLRSRLSLMRRLASHSLERRSRSAWFSCLSSSISLISTPRWVCGRHLVPLAARQSDAANGFETRLARMESILPAWVEIQQSVSNSAGEVRVLSIDSSVDVVRGQLIDDNQLWTKQLPSRAEAVRTTPHPGGSACASRAPAACPDRRLTAACRCCGCRGPRSAPTPAGAGAA